jgi:hypothetical protein
MIASDAWLEDFKKSQNSPSGVLCFNNCITLPPQLDTFLQHTTFVGFVRTTLLPLPVPTQVVFLTCLKRMLRVNILTAPAVCCLWLRVINPRSPPPFSRFISSVAHNTIGGVEVEVRQRVTSI